MSLQAFSKAIQDKLVTTGERVRHAVSADGTALPYIAHDEEVVPGFSSDSYPQVVEVVVEVYTDNDPDKALQVFDQICKLLVWSGWRVFLTDGSVSTVFRLTFSGFVKDEDNENTSRYVARFSTDWMTAAIE
jgi:hypothetical protein